MATVKLFAVTPLFDLLPYTEAGTLLDHGETFAAVDVGHSNRRKIFIGEGFEYENGELIAGTATEIVYKLGGWQTTYRITDIDWDMSNGMSSFFDDETLLGGDDLFIGSKSSDAIDGLGGADDIKGRNGRDQITGGLGDDIVKGGKGRDTFVFATGDGIDAIVDFDIDGHPQDRLHFLEVTDMSGLTLSQRGHRVVIEHGEGDKVILRQIDIDDLGADNFVFGEI